ncbi:helix-turn-helix domain-containing protein [Streptomyces cyaneochromogenes]|nr:helix-turn-helix domain-containing protein [Streptomyces cyaneochromogenes]
MVLDISESEAAEAIEALKGFHLIGQVNDSENLDGMCDRGPWWRAVHPHLATAHMASAESRLRRRLYELDARRDLVTALASSYPARPHRGSQPPEAIEVVDSLDDVITLIEQASAECEQEMITCQPGGGRPTAELEQAVARDTALLGRGVRMRTLYQHSARRHAPTQAYVDRIAPAGAEVRTMTDLFGRLIAFDRRIAFIPHHQRRGGAVVLRSPAAVAFLCEAFDRAWDHATPFCGAERTEAAVDGLRQGILRLLSKGLKDEVIARRLGISLRTCRKHIADLFQELHAESRFQAGYLAATHDLLRDTP